MNILERYIIKENLKPFFVSLLIFTSIFVLDIVVSKLSIMLEKQVPFIMVLKFLYYSLCWIFALTVPMSILIASITSFGRLSTDNEIIAIKSCGINVFSLMRPFFFIILLLSMFMIYFNNYVMPENNQKIKKLLIEIIRRKPINNISAGIFNKDQDYANYVIYAEERKNDELLGIVIYNHTARDVYRIITATHGNIVLAEGGNLFVSILYDGEIHEKSKRNVNEYRYTKFKRLVFTSQEMRNMSFSDDNPELSDREMTSKDLKNKINEINTQIANVNKNNNSYIMELEKLKGKFLVEYHKKYALAFACVIFAMVGVPFGLMTKNSGIGLAFLVSSIIFIFYYAILIYGEVLADKNIVSPFIAMWISNFVLGIISILLIINSIREQKVIRYDLLFKKLKFLKRRKLK